MSSSKLTFCLFLIFLIKAISFSQALCQISHIDSVSKNVVQIESLSRTGSGVIIPIDDKLIIFTNRHIVEGSYQFTINVLHDVNEPAEPKFSAELVGFSSEYDFAILEITANLDGSYFNYSNYVCNNSSDSFCFTEMGFPDYDNIVKRGDNIGLLGYPVIGNNELIYSTGIISSLKYEFLNNQRTLVWIRTDAEMSPGNSGGLAIKGNGVPLGLPTYVSRESRTGGRLGNILSFDLIFQVINNGDITFSWENFVAGQVALDFSQEPEFGEVTLSSGFYPNIFEREIIAGGSNRVDHIGYDCVGFAATKPDFRLQWHGDTNELFFMFFADNDSEDATLVINTPDGNWHCNDDAFDGTLNPAIVFSAPLTGQYDIWVGSYHEGEFINGKLLIIENLDVDDQTIDWNLTPHFGVKSLSAGFLPDPYSVLISAGGTINIRESNLGRDCIGYVAEAPDFRLQWSGNSSRLIFSFVANIPSDDTTLIINSPNGSWHCNDDAHSNTLNPQVIFHNPSQGQYDIWVGTYHNVDLIRGKLLISEIDDNIP